MSISHPGTPKSVPHLPIVRPLGPALLGSANNVSIPPKIFDAYYDDDKTYIVLEFCENGALDTCLRKHGPVPEHTLSVIVRQIFLGLSFLYRAAIVHRDMKPANCLVDSQVSAVTSCTDALASFGDAGRAHAQSAVRTGGLQDI